MLSLPYALRLLLATRPKALTRVFDGACLIARILAHWRERGAEDAPASPLGPRARGTRNPAGTTPG
ncbi:MAG: hypothetical protein WAW79_05450, partial [Steroidobacteraceae bacterium]